TTASNMTPRKRPASGSVFCGSLRRPASRWWPLTCPSRPSAMWRSPATSFVGDRPSGITDRNSPLSHRPHAIDHLTGLTEIICGVAKLRECGAIEMRGDLLVLREQIEQRTAGRDHLAADVVNEVMGPLPAEIGRDPHHHRFRHDQSASDVEI